MNEKRFILDYYEECSNFLLNTDVSDNIIAAKEMILSTQLNGGKLIFAGNGASASIANHASLDFTKQGKVRSVNFNESAFFRFVYDSTHFILYSKLFCNFWLITGICERERYWIMKVLLKQWGVLVK